jgi:hypothetical protein
MSCGANMWVMILLANEDIRTFRFTECLPFLKFGLFKTVLLFCSGLLEIVLDIAKYVV